jgi:hypothetical protein
LGYRLGRHLLLFCWEHFATHKSNGIPNVVTTGTSGMLTEWKVIIDPNVFQGYSTMNCSDNGIRGMKE